MKKKTIFSEVRCDYFDETDNEWCVDAWYPHYEEGVVAARINPDTLEVRFMDSKYKSDFLVHETIANKLREILN